MTTSSDEQIFWDLVDEFIARANERCEDVDPGMVSAALLQASARFGAFVVASASVDRKEFSEEIESSTRYLTNQYRSFLQDNLEDYRENYKVYLRPEDE